MTTRDSLQILNETFFGRSASPYAQMLFRSVLTHPEQHETVCGWMAERGQTTTPPRFRFTPTGEAFEWSELDVSPWKLEPQEGALLGFQDWADSLPWQRGSSVSRERMKAGSNLAQPGSSPGV